MDLHKTRQPSQVKQPAQSMPFGCCGAMLYFKVWLFFLSGIPLQRPFCPPNMSRHGNKTEDKHPVHHVHNKKIWPGEIPWYVESLTLEWRAAISQTSRGFTGLQCRLPFWYVRLRFSNDRLESIFVTCMIWPDLLGSSCLTPLNDTRGSFGESNPSECEAWVAAVVTAPVWCLISERSSGRTPSWTPSVQQI